MNIPQTYYAAHGPMSDPRQYTSMFSDLSVDLPSLVKIVQNNLLHVFWAERYGVSLTESQKETLQVRSVAGKLSHIQSNGCGPLEAPRTPVQRQVGNCRDFSLFLVSMLRHLGVPARARCGFGTYFLPNHYEDHWVGEYWNSEQNRWVMVDAQMDPLQIEVLQLDFDPLDVPSDRFIVGGKAWQMARSGQADPESFGIFEWHGMDFIRGDLFRDILSLNKMEILPWDFGWGLLSQQVQTGTPEDNALFDRIATITLGGDATFQEVQQIYQSEPGLQATEEWLKQAA